MVCLFFFFHKQHVLYHSAHKSLFDAYFMEKLLQPIHAQGKWKINSALYQVASLSRLWSVYGMYRLTFHTPGLFSVESAGADHRKAILSPLGSLDKYCMQPFLML